MAQLQNYNKTLQFSQIVTTKQYIALLIIMDLFQP